MPTTVSGARAANRTPGTEPRHAVRGTTAPPDDARFVDVLEHRPQVAHRAQRDAPLFSAKPLDPSDVSGSFKHWYREQAAQVPEIKAVVAMMRGSMKNSPPKTVGALLASAVEVARAEVASRANGPMTDALVDRASMVALTALANLTGAKGLPHYIPDGRSGCLGNDTTWHLMCQALFAGVVLYDRRRGDGQTAARFLAVLDDLDREDQGRHVGAAYDRTEGRTGALLPTVLVIDDEIAPPYFSRPQDFEDAEEALAYDAAVRLGDAYELHSTPDTFARCDVEAIGTRPWRTDPTLPLEAAFGTFSGLADPGVTRDMTANRVGAYVAVRLFREGTLPTIPFDEGRAIEAQPHRTRTHVDLVRFCEEEHAALDALASMTGGDVSSRAGADVGDLLQRMEAETDRLGASDHAVLSAYYAQFCVRLLRLGLPVSGDRYAASSAVHSKRAQTMSGAALFEDLKARLELVASYGERAADDPAYQPVQRNSLEAVTKRNKRWRVPPPSHAANCTMSITGPQGGGWVHFDRATNTTTVTKNSPFGSEPITDPVRVQQLTAVARRLLEALAI